MNKKHTTLAFRFLWTILAVHVLNCSLYIPDPPIQNSFKKSSFQKQESVDDNLLEEIIELDSELLATNGSMLGPAIRSDERLQTKTFNFHYNRFHQDFHPESVTPPPKS